MCFDLYGLSWATHSVSASAAQADWLERLCRFQAAIGPRGAGRPVTAFEYLAPQVIRSRWGDLKLVANLSSEAWQLDAATAVAPEGTQQGRESLLVMAIGRDWEGKPAHCPEVSSIAPVS